jgi:hypothetical protein
VRRVEEPLPHLDFRHPTFSAFRHLVAPFLHHHLGELMSIATTTEPTTGQQTASRTTTSPTNNPATQTSPNAAQRLRTTMAAVKLSFTWLGVRKTLAPEQRTTAARAFHADRELLSA